MHPIQACAKKSRGSLWSTTKPADFYPVLLLKVFSFNQNSQSIDSCQEKYLRGDFGLCVLSLPAEWGKYTRHKTWNFGRIWPSRQSNQKFCGSRMLLNGSGARFTLPER